MTSRYRRFATAPLLLSLFLACGGDESAVESTATPGSTGGNGTSGSVGAAGTTANGGTGGSAGTTSTGGAGASTAGSAGSVTATTGPLGDNPALPIDATTSVSNLSAPVDVVRDTYGRPHIYASTAADAFRVEGYLVTQDRSVQLELLRRAAEGRLAEGLALNAAEDSLIDTDITYRTIGLGRVAQQEYDMLDPAGETKLLLDAYADGVTQAFHDIKSGKLKIPPSISVLFTELFTDWTAVDTLAIGRLQTWLLSFDATDDMENQIFFDQVKGKFVSTSPDPALAKRAGLERDLYRFAPGDPATTTDGYPTKQSKSGKVTTPPSHAPISQAYLKAVKRGRDLFATKGFGSNDWAISGAKSSTGNALVASDPHLQLSSPSIFWPVSIDVTAPPGGDATQDLHLGGIAFGGIPGIILGHNANIGWGSTVAGYDVSDVYSETLTADGKSVMRNGMAIPLQEIDEVINRADGAPYTYKVMMVPGHGPIQPNIQPDHTVLPPDPKTGALSIKWTGLQPTNEIAAVLKLMRAPSVDDARTALNDFGVGAQNWMLGDTNGDILWTSHALVPTRDQRAFTWDASKYQGTLPCFVLPGDGTAEWTGFLPDDTVPWQKNPSKGYISTANNDPIGTTLDNDPSNDTLPDGTPQYLACSYDIGFREGRIHERIEGETGMISPDDMASIQADSRAPIAVHLVPALLTAIANAQAEATTPGTHPDLTAVVKDPTYKADEIAAALALLTAWQTESDYASHEGMDLDTNMPLDGSTPEARASEASMLFHSWFIRDAFLVLGDELTAAGLSGWNDEQYLAKSMLYLFQSDPKTMATYDATTGDSALWDDLTTTTVVESRDERSIRALISALQLIDTKSGSLDATRWGAFHTLTFAPLAAPLGVLQIPPSTDAIFPHGFPRHGAVFTVDVGNFSLWVPTGSDPDFTYGEGPTQRFVVDLGKTMPSAWNALPGGEIADPKSPHFRDEAEFWRKNKNHPIPYDLADVIAAKESRTLFNLPGN